MTAVEVFPVIVVAIQSPDVITRRNGTKKKCTMLRRHWYADWHLARRGRHLHRAQDIFAPRGSLVVAPNAGRIVGSTKASGPTVKGGHGVVLAVQGRGGTVRTYSLTHLDGVPRVGVGDEVEAGDLIGTVGNSGNATHTCPHLHIGARRYRRGRAIQIFDELRAVDPTRRRANADRRTKTTSTTPSREATRVELPASRPPTHVPSTDPSPCLGSDCSPWCGGEDE